MQQTLALFDFDGTITNRDSLFHFLAFTVSKPQFIWKLSKCIPNLVSFKLGLTSNSNAKQKMFSVFCRGAATATLCAKAENYCNTQLNNILRESALQKIQWHLAQGHTVVVVSASLDIWLQPFCDAMKLRLIATKAQSTDGYITGKFASKNCNGAEKVERIKREIDLDFYSSIVAYGDSKGDIEMLKLANESHYKPFR